LLLEEQEGEGVANQRNSDDSGASGEPVEGFHPLRADYYYEDKVTTIL